MPTKNSDDKNPTQNPTQQDPAQTEAHGAKARGVEAVVAAMPYNASKAGEYDDAAQNPAPGVHVPVEAQSVTGSTLTEANSSPKVGGGQPTLAFNTGNMSLDRARSDSSQRPLT